MNKHSSTKPSSSLLERAAEMYDFGAQWRGGAATTAPTAPVGVVEDQAPIRNAVTRAPMTTRPASSKFAQISRERLAAKNFIVPDGPVNGLSEEFRIVKRQLLLSARGGKGIDALPYGERILVCSANPNEGKTFCAINLAMSIAMEMDHTVLLVDADVARPSVRYVPSAHLPTTPSRSRSQTTRNRSHPRASR